jgi:hypothetical protein
MKDNIIIPRSNHFSQAQTNAIIEAFQKSIKRDDFDDTYAIIAIFVQQGVRVESCSGNFEIQSRESKIRLAQIREGFKQAGSKKALRKFACTNASRIA